MSAACYHQRRQPPEREAYPHATLAVIEDAGHALMHERPDLLAALFGDWLDRARPKDD